MCFCVSFSVSVYLSSCHKCLNDWMMCIIFLSLSDSPGFVSGEDRNGGSLFVSVPSILLPLIPFVELPWVPSLRSPFDSNSWNRTSPTINLDQLNRLRLYIMIFNCLLLGPCRIVLPDSLSLCLVVSLLVSFCFSLFCLSLRLVLCD